MLCTYTFLIFPSDLSKFRLGLVQMLVGADKAANLVRAAKLVKEGASNGAQVVALPVSVSVSGTVGSPLCFICDVILPQRNIC